MMVLEVRMSPWQYRDGYADRIGELLVDGAFVGCPGKWHVRRKLAAVEVDSARPVTIGDRARPVTIDVRRVAFEIEPVDAVARRVELFAEAPP